MSALSLVQVPVASSISVEPASEDDWELVEIHAGYMEEQMLNQVDAPPTLIHVIYRLASIVSWA